MKFKHSEKFGLIELNVIKVMSAYEFIVALHQKGGTVVNQHVMTGGCLIKYTEPNDTEVKEIFCNRA
jgi:hypothetical protein